MKCPVCENSKLEKTILHNTEIDFCFNCLGFWLQKDELRWLKDEKDKDLKWFDIDLWQDEKKFKITREIKLCPECRVPLYEVEYGDSKI
ncbi:MAG: zf-TFIIB domain-containing protein, partial [Candidatus Pacebacteria bacterium]|nr:zf-TFIIB domain-containing protein [Candidatus Paceibacterota bacterium]